MVADDQAAFRALSAEAQKVMAGCHATGIELKTVESYPDDDAHAMGRLRHALDTQSRRSGGVNAPRLAKKLGAKMKIVRQAERAGLSFAERATEPGALDLWYDIYQAS